MKLKHSSKQWTWKKHEEKGNRLKSEDVAIEYFNLIRNQNGFEESIGTGTKEDMEKLRLDFENKNDLKKKDGNGQAWERVSYYILPKREWDLEHCPLMPVDYS
jgi:hypothetical protein